MARASARTAKNLASPDIAARLERAVSLHKQGKWRQAEPLYRKIIRQAPKNFIALHLLGVVALERRKFDDAEELIRRALALNPDYPEALINLGNVMLEQRRFDEAKENYQKVLALKPDSVDALNNLGNVLLGLERFDEALENYDRALAVRPGFVDAQYNRGNALNALGRWDDALACYDNALAVRPDYMEAHYNRGLVLTELDRKEDALASFDRALEIDRHFVKAHRRRGMVLASLERWEEALANDDRLLSLQPDDDVGLRNRGTALFRLKRWEEALASFDRLLSLDSEDAAALSGRGSALRELGRIPAALAAYEAALAICPDYVEALSNRGNVLAQLDRLDEALASYDQALALDPENSNALSNRGNCLKYLGRPEDALFCYEQALAVDPDDPMIHYNEGLCRLLMGDFELGWPKYEYRLSALRPAGARNFAVPKWGGREPLDGKAILLHAEQGLGDTLQFCRFAPMVTSLGARVILEVQPPLKALMQGLQGVEQVIARGEEAPDADYHCSLLSLPAAFRIRLDSIPGPPAYLGADPAAVARWSERLGARTRPRVGLAWAGTAGNTDDRRRSIPLSALFALTGLDVDFFSLHHEIRPDDEAALATMSQLTHFGADIANFVDTAALASLMDVVVLVDTSLGHLSAALGRPTWILLPRVPDWRWMLDRDDSPWYPTARLFRQSDADDWSTVLECVREELQRACTNGG